MFNKLLKVLFALFFVLDFTGQCYGQTSCSTPSCPTLTITGPDKVSYGESKSYTLTGASSSQNIRWSVDNPNVSISGNNSGATLTVGSACDCNNGVITITAKDTGTGCYTTFRVQAGTWVTTFDQEYTTGGGQWVGSCRMASSPFGCSINDPANCDITEGNTWTYYKYACMHTKVDYPCPGGCSECIQHQSTDIPAACFQPPYGTDCGWQGCGSPPWTQPPAPPQTTKVLTRKRVNEWKCPVPSQQTCGTCSLGIAYFKTSAASFDPYSETICLSGLVDEATGRSVGWTIEIKDSTGLIVKQFSGGASYVAASWDGRDGNGSIVPGGTYTAILTGKTSDGGCTATSNITIAVESCDLSITKVPSNSTIDPGTGGSVEISGSVSDSSGEPISWEITLPDGNTVSDTGTNPSATWNGRRSDGTVMKPEIGQIIEPTATIKAWRTNSPSCNKSEKVNIKIEWSGGCMLLVNVGSSANLASGNLSHNQEIFSTNGSVLATNMTLYYNSLDSYTGTLGRGWTHTYDIAIGESEDGYVVLREGDGGRKVYTKDGDSYINQQGDYSTLTKNPDGTFTITNKDGLKYNFNSDGKRSSIVDRNNNTMTFAYTNGDLITITDSSGRTTTLSYNTDHRISTISDPNGNTHTFTYSGNDLVSITTQSSVGSQQLWSYTYYDNSFLHTKTDPNGYTTTYTYDQDYRLATSTDPEGNIKSIAYPSLDDTSQTKTTTVTEKDGGNWTYSYDTGAGTLSQKTDPENGTTSYTYDENRNMTSKTEPDGSVTSYTYDTSGNRASTTDALGQTTTYTYNSYGQATSITAPDNTTTSYEYDASGNLTKTTDSTGASTGYQYDSKGNVTKITNAAGQTTFTYDQSGNLASITDSTGATTTFTYDAAGNMISQTDASGATTRFEYNSLNQLVRVIDPNGSSTTNTYDANGNKTSSTDANGNVTYYEYNYKGQLIKVKDALGNVTTYTYGGTGCSSCGGGTDKLTAITDANGNATKYEYDTLGRLTKEADPLGNAISYSYDSKGNLISKTDANGSTINYSYDSLGRLLKKTYPDTTTESFTYDAKGNILTATNANISYSLSYNTSGKATSVTDSNGRTVSYQYDTLGNKTKLTYPEGSSVAYSYDTANRLTKITNGGGKIYSYQYDSLGRRAKLSLPNGATANYSYDTAGRFTNLSHKTSSGSTIATFAYTHDNAGNRLTKALDTGTKYTYTYDSIYRLTEALSSTPGYSSNTTSKGNGTTTATQQQKEYFTYDPVGNRLSSDTYNAYTYNQANQLLSNGGTYSYDKNGNLTSKIDGTTTYSYSYDYENRLTKVIKIESTSTTTSEFKYDPFGRRIEKKVINGTTTTTKYVYDNEDIVLEYDGSNITGNRYIHGPGIDEPLAVINGKNTYYYHADGLGSIVALTDSAGKTQQTYEYDSFGNLKDQKNKVKQPYTYTGREWDKEAGLYYYRARYYDPMNGRFTSFDPLLHPANGFSKVKSCSQSAGHPTFKELMKKPQKLNPYNYADANPVMLKDPMGLGACGSGKNEPYVPDNYGFYNLTGPCENHDKCYGTCGSSKTMCDISLFGDILKECSKLTWDPINQVGCIEVAYIYYYAVTVGGYSAFQDAQKEACCK